MYKNIHAGIVGILIFLYLLPSPNVNAQNILAIDTLSLTLKNAEKIFFEQNLALLAQKYNVEADKALIEQAKLWDNPTITTDNNIYANRKWFEFSTNSDGSYNGQLLVQAEQLIKTANKRGKLIQLAKTNTAISEWEFKDLMRNLKYQLRKDFYTLAKHIQTRKLYAEQEVQINKLLQGLKAQYASGNIAYKDLLRIQALQISVQQDAVENEKGLNEVQAELKTLLRLNSDVTILPVIAEDNNLSTSIFNVEDLIAAGKTNNASYQIQQLNRLYGQQHLSYQKALAAPDVAIVSTYDRNSNYTKNYVGLGISMPLPLLNRNQGNIKQAQWAAKAKEVDAESASLQLSNDIRSAYNNWSAVHKLYDSSIATFNTNYRKLNENITESYKQRQISLIEFVDYFDTYKEVQEKSYQLQLNMKLAKEDLNYQIGIDTI